MWWNDDFFYRRKITLVAPPEPVSIGNVVTVVLDKILMDNGKIRSDFGDVAVVYRDSDGDLYQIFRSIEEYETGIYVSFQLQDSLDQNVSIEDQYRIYYGDPELFSELVIPDPILVEPLFPNEDIYPEINPWSSTLSLEGSYSGYGSLSFTRPGEHWNDGVSSVRHARANVLFYATSFRIISSIGDSYGIMEVQVDGSDWKSVDLFSRDEIEFYPVFEIGNLDPLKPHEVRIRVSGRQNPFALDDKVNIKGIEYIKPIEAFDVGEEVHEEAWSSYVGGV